MDAQKIFENYESHSLTQHQEAHVLAVKQNIRNTAVVVNDFCDECREKSLALTKLEEASMWATAAIARSKEVGA